MKYLKCRQGSALFICLAGLIVGTCAAAESTISASDELTEITVTAQKQSASLQSTPIAVTAVDGSKLAELGIVDMRGVDVLVPSAQFQEERGATKVFLRGVGTFLDLDSSDPAVTTNMDEVYTPREATGGSLYDVKDVEVLSGPQGTLYGRNAAGGAVNVMTNNPTDVFGGKTYVEGGNYGLAHFFGVINTPLSSTFAVRTAIDYQRHNGYLSDGMDDQKAIGVRVKALYTPNEQVSVLAGVEYYHDGGNGDTPVYRTPSREFPSSQSPFTLNIDPQAAGWFRKYYYDKAYVRAQFDLGAGISLVYIPAYIKYDDDANFLNGPGSLEIHPQASQYTQELRFQQTTERINWVLGGYWYKSDGSTYSNLTLAPIPALYPQAATNPLDVHSKSYAAFGQATYSVSDMIRLIAGVRYSDDKRNGSGQNLFSPAPGLSFPTPFSADLSSTHVDYRLGVQMDVTPRNMVYATVSTGYNEGGFAPLSSNGVAGYTFKPETLRSYAVGSKNRVFDNRFEINDEVYFYDLRDYQVSAFNQALGGLIIVNAQKAQMFGNDLSLRLNATDNDKLSFVLGVESAKAIDFGIPATLVGAANACNCDGYRLPNAPGATASIDYAHTFHLAQGGTVIGDVNSYYSTSYWDVYNHPRQTDVQAYTKTNVTLTYHAPAEQGWYVSLWARNLENKARYGSISAPSSQLAPTTGFIDPPLTFGAQAGLTF